MYGCVILDGLWVVIPAWLWYSICIIAIGYGDTNVSHCSQCIKLLAITDTFYYENEAYIHIPTCKVKMYGEFYGRHDGPHSI